MAFYIEGLAACGSKTLNVCLVCYIFKQVDCYHNIFALYYIVLITQSVVIHCLHNYWHFKAFDAISWASSINQVAYYFRAV